MALSFEYTAVQAASVMARTPSSRKRVTKSIAALRAARAFSEQSRSGQPEGTGCVTTRRTAARPIEAPRPRSP